MNRIISKTALLLLAVAAPLSASTSATIEGHWANPHHTVIVNVSHCGDAFCGTVSWSNARNHEKGTVPGIRVLSDFARVGMAPTGGARSSPSGRCMARRLFASWDPT